MLAFADWAKTSIRLRGGSLVALGSGEIVADLLVSHDARLERSREAFQNRFFSDCVTLNCGKFGLRRVLLSKS